MTNDGTTETDNGADASLAVRGTTDGRTWGHVPYVVPSLPVPSLRATEVNDGDPVVPPNARRIARAASAVGWPVRITHAIGHDLDTATGGVRTTAIKEPTGETTPTGRPAMKEVGHTENPPVHSVRVVISGPDLTFVGHWVNGGFDAGLILAGHVWVRNCGWTVLRKEFDDAKSRADVCGETSGAGEWTSPQLPLESHDGKPL